MERLPHVILAETAMELIPSERAVLNLIRVLFLEASERTHPLTALRAQWPVSHAEAYSGGYVGLIKKGLIAASGDGQRFSITNAGLQAMAKGAVNRVAG
jgi:hypothetical protein